MCAECIDADTSGGNGVTNLSFFKSSRVDLLPCEERVGSINNTPHSFISDEPLEASISRNTSNEYSIQGI